MRSLLSRLFGPAAVLVLNACGGSVGGGVGTPVLSPLAAAHDARSYTKIHHVVIVIQENRSFDDFFATFPGADGATEGLMKTGKGDRKIKLISAPSDSDSLGHQHYSFEKEFDHGKMDGFNLVDRALSRGDKIPAGRYAYRYSRPKDIAPYWTIAKTYVLGDHMFPTQGSSSFTGHQDLIAGGTPVDGDNVIDFPTPAAWGCDAPAGTVTSLITPQGKYLRGKGPFPCFNYATLRDLLDEKAVSWLYFTNTTAGSLWNAFDAIKAVRYGNEWTANIVKPETKFFKTVADRALPDVSWVIPDALNSDHPGNHSDRGPSWVASIVNAVGQSEYWDSTAIFVVWDDWGGEYDNVPPPQLDGQGLGIRVPLLLISAYAREKTPGKPGWISHTRYEFGSVLKFVENNWHLGRLGTSDVRAKSMIDCFDFAQPPRPFVMIPSKYSKAYFERQPPSGLPLDTDD
ncbi:MAG TPA: alkaline phosphatase family protein [Candidatus Cybelea sp.]|jgi:phospholipase C|nr:alkaline phosphatase family protein [Candidatus Cybelea sp.]